MKVICTDRHTHPARVLGHLVVEQTMPAGGRAFVLVPWVPKRIRQREEQRGTLHVPPCPTCRRTVPLTQERVAKVYDALIGAGINELDVSAIP
jgi:hypothetical protein